MNVLYVVSLGCYDQILVHEHTCAIIHIEDRGLVVAWLSTFTTYTLHSTPKPLFHTMVKPLVLFLSLMKNSSTFSESKEKSINDINLERAGISGPRPA